MTDYDQMLELVKRYHAGQTREGGVMPYWPHCERTALSVRQALEASGEGTARQREVLLLAGLGHDLYEDTTIVRQEIIDRFGADVDTLIEEVTNPFGDGHADRYANKLASASEMALLEKFSDMADNYRSGHLSLRENGEAWTRGFLWPILDVQWQAIKNIPFSLFPKTADFLKREVSTNREILEQALKLYLEGLEPVA